MARPEKFRLGDILVNQKFISQEQLNSALEDQKRTGRKLGRVIIENGFVTENEISEALARQMNIPFIDLKHFDVKPQAVRLLPETQARRFRAMVLEERTATVLVGMADPTDLFAYDELSKQLKREIELAVVNEGLMLETIDRLYRRTEEISDLAKELGEEIGDTVIDFGGLGTSQSLEEAPVVKLLQTVFEDATQVGASDIHIEPQEKNLQIRFRIDGVLHLQMQADSKISSAVILRLKLMSGLDISEKRIPQDGRFAIKVKSQQIDVRISTMPTQYGESVVMRLLNQSGGALGLDRIGMPPEMLERFRKMIHQPNGMVLVTGPTGSGKTTTLYAALSELNKVESKVLTVEDPVEYRLPGVNQVQVNEKIDLTFARILRSFMRQDPDIILVGEMRDAETAQIGLRAAMTGHFVLSTLHTNDAASTPTRLIDMGAPSFMLATSLQGVVAQRLVRRVCESCGAPHVPTLQEHAWLKFELGDSVDQNKYVQGRGCTHCNNTGYKGRVGVYEMLEINESVANALSSDDSAQFRQAASAQMAGRTLRQHAVSLVTEGVTTVSEAMRISNLFED